MARQGGGGFWGCCPRAPAVLVAAHGALRAMAVGLVPVAVLADAVPAAALLALPVKGACRHQPGDWDGQDVPEAGAGSGPAVNPTLPWVHFFPHLISLKAQCFPLPSAPHHPPDIPITAPRAPAPHSLGSAQMECPHSALLKCVWRVRAGAHVFGLTAGFWKATCPSTCSSPLLAFVNSKSGDNQGVKFLRKFKQFLNPAQVFDLMNGGPHLG